jgi:hypothetical protein
VTFSSTVRAAALPLSYEDAVLAFSPSAYWKLGEASGNFADSSGNSRTLTAINLEAEDYRAASIFSGGDYSLNVDTADEGGWINAQSWCYPANFTIVGWIRPDAVNNTRTFCSVRAASAGASVTSWGMRITGSKFSSYVSNGTAFTIINGVATLSSNTTYMTAFVVDTANDEIITYLNGSEDDSLAFTGTVGTGGDTLRIGYATFTDSDFDGRLAHFALFPSALTPAQIGYLYGAGTA